MPTPNPVRRHPVSGGAILGSIVATPGIGWPQTRGGLCLHDAADMAGPAAGCSHSAGSAAG
jgi:hypothetical protein